MLGEENQKYLEAAQYFQNIDSKISDLHQNLNAADQEIIHYLNLLNSKIDYLARKLLMRDSIQLRKVNISLGGMSFKTTEEIKEHNCLKILLYTKPKMIPIILDATVVYAQYIDGTMYRISVSFNQLTSEQEQLLSQHILLIQTKLERN
jgi:hypothetical protein